LDNQPSRVDFFLVLKGRLMEALRSLLRPPKVRIIEQYSRVAFGSNFLEFEFVTALT
jgi:hypothetical protein